MSYVSGASVHTAMTLGLLGFAVAGISIALYNRLDEAEEASMAKFQLEPGRTKKEFMALWAGSVFMIVGFTTYVYGAFVGADLYLNIGRYAFSLYSVVLGAVLLDWWRRF